jgi:hypothetical protein
MVSLLLLNLVMKQNGYRSTVYLKYMISGTNARHEGKRTQASW